MQEILAYWQESGLTALAWILPGLGETALLFLLRWGLDTLRQTMALPQKGERAVKQDYIEAPRPRRGKGDRWPLRLAGWRQRRCCWWPWPGSFFRRLW